MSNHRYRALKDTSDLIVDYLSRSGGAEGILSDWTSQFMPELQARIEDALGEEGIEALKGDDDYIAQILLDEHTRIAAVEGVENPSSHGDYGDEYYDPYVRLRLGDAEISLDPNDFHYVPNEGFSCDGFTAYRRNAEGKFDALEIKSPYLKDAISDVLNDYFAYERHFDCDIYTVENPLTGAQWHALWAAIGLPGTPLHAACEASSVELIRCLIESGLADLDAKDDLGLTPLMVAVESTSENAVRLLLEAGADRHALDSQGLDALARFKAMQMSPRKDGLIETLEQLFLSAGVRDKRAGKNAHHRAAEAGL